MSSRSFGPQPGRARLHWVDVREYGAVLDGATNDTAAVTAAVAALGANPGVLYVPGVAALDPDVVVLRTGQTLLGDGPGRSRLVQRAGTAGTALVSTFNFAALTGTDVSAGTPYGFGIAGITLDGNKAATTGTPRGVAIYGHSHVVRDVHVRDCRGAGFWSEWSTAGESDQGTMEAHLTGVKVVDCGGVGLHWAGPHDSVVAHSEVARCGQTVATHGVEVTGGALGTEFAGIHVWGEFTDYAWWLDAQAIRCVDCVAEGSQLAQVRITDSWVFWRAGHVYSADINPASNVGFLIGSPTSWPTGLDIDTRVDSCGGGAIKYDYGSANRFSVQATYYPAAAPDQPGLGVIGADRPNDTIRVSATDASDNPTVGSRLVQPGPVVVNRATAVDSRPLLDVRNETGTQLWKVAANGDMVVGGASSLAAVQASGRVTVTGVGGLSSFALCGRKTTSGAPTTGTWLAGDLVLDSVGVWHLCTAAGTPGTWT